MGELYLVQTSQSVSYLEQAQFVDYLITYRTAHPVIQIILAVASILPLPERYLITSQNTRNPDHMLQISLEILCYFVVFVYVKNLSLKMRLTNTIATVFKFKICF